jgi:hypothetical protein
MAGLTLGSVTLAAFEIPGRVQFGGKQALAVHQLPGGVRVIDAMGRDDTDISWSGILSGGDASGRARLLDAMRAAGSAITLSWDVFAYSVVIADLQLVYHNPWWIPYHVICKIVTDQAQYVTPPTLTDATAIVSDLSYAASLTNVINTEGAISASGAFTAGTQANASAVLAIATSVTAIDSGIQAAEQAMQSGEIPTVVAAAGSLAYLTSAQGFVGRAATNLQNVSN